MSRCQRRIVSGVTSSCSPWRRAFGITLSKAASSARSAQVRCGRCGCRRCSTPKVADGLVHEVGIADPALTQTLAVQGRLGAGKGGAERSINRPFPVPICLAHIHAEENMKLQGLRKASDGWDEVASVNTGWRAAGFSEKARQCHQQTIRSIAVARRSRKASRVVTSCLIPMDVLIKV